MSNIRQILGKNIRRFRENKGMTQEELAEMVDVSGSYIGYLERGKQSPSLMLLEKISLVLGVTPAILLTSQDEIKNLELEKLIMFLSDKTPRTIRFLYKVAVAYFKSLEIETE